MRGFSGWYAPNTNYEGCNRGVTKQARDMILKTLDKILQVLHFVTLCYAKWYGASLSVTNVTFVFRQCYVTRLLGVTSQKGTQNG